MDCCNNFDKENWNVISLFEKIKQITIGQIVFAGFFVFVGVYFMSDSFSSKPPVNGKVYTKRISVSEYEEQKRYYTQLKLAELYSSKEYQDHAKRKIQESQPNFRSYEYVSDDE